MTVLASDLTNLAWEAAWTALLLALARCTCSALSHPVWNNQLERTDVTAAQQADCCELSDVPDKVLEGVELHQLEVPATTLSSYQVAAPAGWPD